MFVFYENARDPNFKRKEQKHIHHYQNRKNLQETSHSFKYKTVPSTVLIASYSKAHSPLRQSSPTLHRKIKSETATTKEKEKNRDRDRQPSPRTQFTAQ